jgi:DNA-binding NarL/FixJ family response regulator
MIRVLIADDHSLMIDGIKTAIADTPDIQIVAEALDGLEVLKILKNQEIDVVLMDINMPLMDGLECTKEITLQFPKVKTIALTQYNETRFVKKMMRFGASGYLLKDTQRDELVEAIRSVYNGNQYFSNNINNGFLASNEVNKIKSELPNLTERELEVLSLICNEHSGPEIAKQINVSFGTVEKHRANLMIKSGSKNTAGLVRWALENNLVQ